MKLVIKVSVVLVLMIYCAGCDSDSVPQQTKPEVVEVPLSPEDLKFNALIEKAEGGDSEAMVELAEKYYWRGDKSASVKENKYRAFSLLEKAAESGNIEACYTVGWHYSRGIKDADETVYATNDQKYFGVQDRIIEGRVYINEDDKKAVFWYTKAVAAGHELAKFRLAEHYFSGAGVLKDPSRAIDMYRSIADNTNSPEDLRSYSAYELGQIFENRDAKLMENHYYTIAAEGGIAEAMYKVGVIAYQNYPDKGKSAYWIGKAYDDHNYEKAKKFWDTKELWRFSGWNP